MVSPFGGTLADGRHGCDSGFRTAFKSSFDEYRRLDDEILPLAVENSNVKAQRLAFGPAREAAEAFKSALDAALRSDINDRCRAAALASKAYAAVLEIEVLQPPHIADAEDVVMTRLEGQMHAAEGVAQDAGRTAGHDRRGSDSASRRGRGRAGRFHRAQPRDRHPLQAEQQRPIAGALTRPEAHGDGPV